MVSAIAAWHRCRAARASINRPGPRNSLAAAGRRHQRGRNPCRKAVIREQGIVRGVARLTVPGELNLAQFEGEKRYWLLFAKSKRLFDSSSKVKNATGFTRHRLLRRNRRHYRWAYRFGTFA